MKPAWTAIKTKARKRRFLRCSGKRRVLGCYAVYTDHINTPRLVTLVNNPLNPVPLTDTSNDLAPADWAAIQGISPQAMPVWQMAYSPFGVDLANGYEARPTTIDNNFKPDLWEWLGLPTIGGAGNWSWYAGGGNGQANSSVLTAPVLNIRYPGQYYDFESGLSQNWWRSYDARMGRYTQADPIGLASSELARWNFPYQDAINYSDPYGLWATTYNFFFGFGWGVTFGYDPETCQPFASARAGIGTNFSAEYDPNAKKPGVKNTRNGIVTGMYGQGGGGVSILGLGLGGEVKPQAGVDRGAGKTFSGVDTATQFGFDPDFKTKFGFGGHTGFEGSYYGEFRCGCSK